MRSKEAPNYSSTRVQRATRLNSIEAARLQQRLHYIEQAKLHQCRLKNQDIRLISMSIDYIQSSSGHSPEAWRPEPKVDEVLDQEEQPPCYLYGERIWSRKKRRFQRPMSAVERSAAGSDLDSSIVGAALPQRPRSSPGKHRSVSVTGWFGFNSSFEDDHDVASASDFGAEKLTLRGMPTLKGRVTPHQDWEDDTSDVTKKILNAQARSISGSRQSVYLSPGDVMTAESSRNVRELARKTRLAATPVTTDLETFPSRLADREQPPKRPEDRGGGLNRRATMTEIINQQRPTLNSGAWRTHLKQTGATPLSITAHRHLMMEAKKEINDTRNERVNEKVRDFIKNPRHGATKQQTSIYL